MAFQNGYFFGGEGVIANNDPDEQDKVIECNDLVANAVIFHNVVDQARVLRELKEEGFPMNREDIATPGPYITSHIKRFGDYIIDSETMPEPIDPSLSIRGNKAKIAGESLSPIFTCLSAVPGYRLFQDRRS